MSKNLEMSYLLDFYGEVLTEKQRDMMQQYFNMDLSLSEIADNFNITRQGVRDAIKRAEAQLFAFEEHIGLCERLEKMRKGLSEISELTSVINEVNRRTILSREINDATARISVLTQMISE